ncbi:MAG: glycosyltransferase [Acidobacteriota bacterium]|jgi:glycosyltransferase involved in cell wall biosynthesis|nr:glycosyltransferase [Acidobacteriota bacterium]
MKILMIAPEPFFEPRGTPFSEYYRIRALSDLGHQVDLVTYPIGADKEVPGLRIFRSLRPFWIREVKTGPSPNKLILDFFLFFSALKRLLLKRYDMIHTHEEASLFGTILGGIFRIPHLYDMHSSLVQQMDNFQFTRSRLVRRLFALNERWALKHARSVIVICRALFEHAAAVTDAKKLTLIENFLDESVPELDAEILNRIRAELPRDRRIVTYTGTLEHYQGIPLLLDSLEYLDPRFHLVLVGGKPAQVDKLRQTARQRNLTERIHFAGQRPHAEIPYYLHLSHVLVSPRSHGTNIPLKIYAYLKSGVPVVATNLYTHTQTLTPDIAVLVDPQPESLAQGIQRADSDEGRAIAVAAQQFAQTHYTAEQYRERVNRALQPIAAPARD